MHGASAPPRPAGPHTLLASMLCGCHKDRQTSPEVCRSFLSSFPTSRHPTGQTAIFSLALGRYSPCDIHRNVRYFRVDEREQPIKSHHLTAKRLNLRTKRCSLFFLGYYRADVIIIKNFWIPFLAFSALDVTSYQLSGLAPTHSTIPCSISVPQFKHVLFPSPTLFHNFFACA